jgi:integrase
MLVSYALWFSAYTFCRPREIRYAEWTEIDFEAREWRIPAEKMKAGRVHIVPLADQTIQILHNVHTLTGHGRYVFPSARDLRHGERPMSDSAIRVALRCMGFTNDQMTAHGFRAMASTILNEQGWTPDVIERQLAHVEGNTVRAAYNHAEHLPQRREMMQHWANWLDGLK